MAENKSCMRQYAIVFLGALLILIAGGILLSGLLRGETERFYRQALKKEMEDLRVYGQKAADNQKLLEESFDKVYQSKALFAAYSVQKDGGFVRDDNGARKLRDHLGCSNVYLLDRVGHTVAKSEDKGIDFTRVRYRMLRAVFLEGLPSDVFSVTKDDGKTYRYYGAKISDDLEVAIEQDDQKLQEMQKKTADLEPFFKANRLSENSYVYVVSAITGGILYDSRGSKPTDTIESYGSHTEDLKDGSISGKGPQAAEYTGTVYLEQQQAYVRTVLPKSDITAIQSRFTGAILVLIGTVVVLLILCAGGGKAAKIALAGTLAVFVLGFVFSGLFVTSEDAYKGELVRSRQEQIRTAQESLHKELSEIHISDYRTHLKAASDIIGRNDFMQSRQELKSIGRTLGFDYIMIYDNDMKERVTGGDYVNLNLSGDETDPFRVLADLRFGVSDRVWGPATDPVTGKYHEYIGVPLKKQDNPDGFIVASVTPDPILAETEYKEGSAGENKSPESSPAEADSGAHKEALRQKAFEYAVLAGGLALVSFALVLFLKAMAGLSAEGQEDSGERNRRMMLVLKTAAVSVAALVCLWVLFPRNMLPSWSALRLLIEEMFRGKSGGSAEGARLSLYKPGIFAFAACLITGAVVYFAGMIVQTFGKLSAAVVDKQKGHSILLICNFICAGLGAVLTVLCLYYFGVPARVIFIIAAVLIAAVGFGGNTVIGDMTAGLWLLLADVLHVGDEIETEGGVGRVKEICLTHTDLIREDGVKIVLCNKDLVRKGLHILG